MALTEMEIRNAKPRAKPYKMYDSNGLYLLIKPAGGKYWRFKYYYADKEKNYAFGVYPEIKLTEARDLRDNARKELRKGVDLSAEKKSVKARAILNDVNNFEAIAREWHEQRKHMWTERHAAKILKMLQSDIFPAISKTPISQVTPPQLLAALKKVESRGVIHTAHRLQQTVGQIFRYAVTIGKAERDIAVDLRGALKPQKKENYARLSENELPEFLAKLEEYQGEEQTQLAVKLLMLTFVRTVELRAARWEEIDFKKAEWRIPAERMKMRKLHIVPLSKQALELFEQQKKSTGNYEYVFPHRNKPVKYMSENTIIYAIYRLGYHNRTTAHGFRGMASTILNEHGFNSDFIERQLAHGERNSVRASYNHAQHLTERRKMMQWWADFLDTSNNALSRK